MSHNDSDAQETSALQGLCIRRLLQARAEHSPDAIAITAPGRAPLTYGRLYLHMDDVVMTLHAMGVGRNDRVAIVLPQGPEMATAFIAVAAGATSAPLNPAYRMDEFDFYLSNLHAKALMLRSGMDSPSRAVAQARGISIIELSPVLEAEAGLFALTGEERLPPACDGFAQPEDVALVLHTSGTTSRPKIVPLTHTNIYTSALNIKVALALAESDRCLNVMPLFHIHGLIAGILASLVAGGSVVCPPGFYAPQFFAWLEESSPTWYTAVPTMHRAILARASANREITARCPLRFIRSSSAPLPPQIQAELEEVFDVPVIESYGMTEASHQMTSNPLPPRKRKAGSVGVAAGPEMAIVDELGNFLRPGETGEIVVRGANVMQGYEDGSEANEHAFTHGWFRTGDEGFLDTEGYLFISGRLKETINRGGEKIAPREVEEVLMQHAAVAQVVAFAVPHAQLGEEVAAAVVLQEGALVTAREIREFAATRLANFKMPRHVLIVSEIPKGPTGKLQRIGLAETLGMLGPDRAESKSKAAFTAPRTPLEENLAEIWAQVLRAERVGIHDNFFELGGDSILAAQMISRLREAMHVELSFLTLVDTPTLAGIVGGIEAAIQMAPALQPPSIRAIRRDIQLPLSYAQQRLWFLEQLEPGNRAYNRPAFLRLTGRLHAEALEQCLNEIMRRHEALRTTFSSIEGRPFQVIRPYQPAHLPVVNLGDLPETERRVEAWRLVTEEAQRPFDLAQGPVLRAALLRLSDVEHLLLLTMHHIVFDGWSEGVLLRELTTLYEAFRAGKPSPLAELPIQYADFAAWQRQWLQGEVLEAQLAYWREQLDGAPAVLKLPTDQPRPAVQTFLGAREPLALSAILTEALKALSQQEGVTLFITLLAAFQALLYRYTGQEDISVGTFNANRTRAETEGLIGFFVNNLVLRTNLSGNPSFRELLGRVRKVTLGAYAHQDLPFEKLLEDLQPKRNLSHSPLFQVMLVLQNTPRPPLEFPNLTVTRYLTSEGDRSNFDLTLWLSEDMDSLTGALEYNTDLFIATTIRRLLEHFRTLLESVVANPDQCLSTLPIVPGAVDDTSVRRASHPERGANLSPAKRTPLANNDWEVLKL